MRVAVLTDIDSIPLGSNFLQRVGNELAACVAVMAVIGPCCA
jgi:hypothetical protein